ncbi:DGQHR domain-containing protein DpdB [Microvirga alba]|uniref:DGQHR domain-containing protein n=1 Tax=Microvirga alba TaxID=2791025 RepID=A0A931BPL5_9HYPH|nr:DGQHR domain-containing protein DpdB [Microvirga alba]MBF9235126.1 DGQHR domain-containing protein [Microvirga alba]
MRHLTFNAIRADQSKTHTVVSIAATAKDILTFAAIERIGRDEEGNLSGFQRPQIATHIREIRDYLEKPDAILPNPIVVAFTKGVKVTDVNGATCRIKIDLSEGPLGLVVDGQQRLTALSQLENKDFKVFVSIVICRDEAELRRQFVLINNTRPLPKSLIYELLPGVENLPTRLEGRSIAAELTDRLNHGSYSLKGKIHQHTNPSGFISDTAIQKVIMNSLNDGILRDLLRVEGGRDAGLKIISEFYEAVKATFPEDWWDHTPRTSRLVHGAGIGSLGYVMEVLAALDGARTWRQFAKGMECLQGRTAWTRGHWDFGGGDVRHWKAIQNVSRDVTTLAQYLLRIVRADIRARRSKGSDPAPLLEAMTG